MPRWPRTSNAYSPAPSDSISSRCGSSRAATRRSATYPALAAELTGRIKERIGVTVSGAAAGFPGAVDGQDASHHRPALNGPAGCVRRPAAGRSPGLVCPRSSARARRRQRQLRSGPCKQRHGRPELLCVNVAEIPTALGPPEASQGLGHRSRGPRTAGEGRLGPPSSRRDRKLLRHRTVAEAGDLREDKPHPVARFAAATQLRDAPVEDAALILSGDEALQVIRVSHLRSAASRESVVRAAGPRCSTMLYSAGKRTAASPSSE